MRKSANQSTLPSRKWKRCKRRYLRKLNERGLPPAREFNPKIEDSLRAALTHQLRRMFAQTGYDRMIKPLGYPILCGALLAVSQGLASCAEEKSSAAAPPLTREHAELVTVTAKVEAIDLPKREVTLKGPL